jgi:carboxymethylenebutenolidase
MIERHINVETPNGSMETFIVHPSAPGPYLVVILYMDVWGIREELRDVARRVAKAGYCCLLPDFYYRFGVVRNEFRDANGRMASLRSLTPDQQEQVRAPMRKLSDSMVMDDTAVLIELIAGLDVAAKGDLAAVGYCMGGRHALVAGGTFPKRFRGVASLHGSDLVLDIPNSPHHIAARTSARVYCGFAERDPYAAPPILRALESEFSRAGVRYSYALHPDLEHGYALPDRDVFDEASTNCDWENIFAMLMTMPTQFSLC